MEILIVFGNFLLFACHPKFLSFCNLWAQTRVFNLPSYFFVDKIGKILGFAGKFRQKSAIITYAHFAPFCSWNVMQYIQYQYLTCLVSTWLRRVNVAAVNITPCRYFFVSFEIFRNRMGLINIHITQGGRRGESSILIIDNKRLLLSSFMSRGLWCFKNIYYPMKSSISTSKYWIKTVLFRPNWAVFFADFADFCCP